MATPTKLPELTNVPAPRQRLPHELPANLTAPSAPATPQSSMHDLSSGDGHGLLDQKRDKGGLSPITKSIPEISSTYSSSN